jgi:hypothetical protein
MEERGVQKSLNRFDIDGRKYYLYSVFAENEFELTITDGTNAWKGSGTALDSLYSDLNLTVCSKGVLYPLDFIFVYSSVLVVRSA